MDWESKNSTAVSALIYYQDFEVTHDTGNTDPLGMVQGKVSILSD